MSRCVLTETYSPRAMETAPAARPARPATAISVVSVVAAATPMTSLWAVETMPSLAPRTPAREPVEAGRERPGVRLPPASWSGCGGGAVGCHEARVGRPAAAPGRHAPLTRPGVNPRRLRGGRPGLPRRTRPRCGRLGRRCRSRRHRRARTGRGGQRRGRRRARPPAPGPEAGRPWSSLRLGRFLAGVRRRLGGRCGGVLCASAAPASGLDGGRAGDGESAEGQGRVDGVALLGVFLDDRGLADLVLELLAGADHEHGPDGADEPEDGGNERRASSGSWPQGQESGEQRERDDHDGDVDEKRVAGSPNSSSISISMGHLIGVGMVAFVRGRRGGPDGPCARPGRT